MTSEPNCFKEIQIVCLWFSFKCSHSVLCCVPRRIIIVSFEFTFCLFRFLFEMSTRLRESVEWNCENEFRDQVKLQRTTQRIDSVLVVVDKFSTKYFFFHLVCDICLLHCLLFTEWESKRKQQVNKPSNFNDLIWFRFVCGIVKMIVYYKFENSTICDRVYFDGSQISVANLRTKIVQQKQLGDKQNFSLKITNAQTKDG